MLESQEKSLFDASPLSSEQVAQYLLRHPEFFLKHPDIVDQIDIEVTGEGVFSLGQLQQRRQRQKILDLEAEIERLRDVASNNDKTFYQFMSLQTRLLECRSLDEVEAQLHALANHLGLQSYLQLFDHDKTSSLLSRDGFKRFAKQHLNGKSAYLGRLRNKDREGLFGKQSAPELGSYVVLPLRYQEQTLGILAFSSEDGGHFEPEMDTLFLDQLAGLVSHLLCVSLPMESRR
ncbi:MULTISPECIES: DUF484 family protein [unclassified Vibrio]|uniref:DUF484 family protein n=1 Tax=Vibrio sp. HB236076 TaxID=3232307 RepID=A0AB39HAM7_9VIBR|nr:DUF484 family protein [Vibrio sp. HB161653]MDP5255713.1 DUF484 family protein [Vibrio sp. HB161653]